MTMLHNAVETFTGRLERGKVTPYINQQLSLNALNKWEVLT